MTRIQLHQDETVTAKEVRKAERIFWGLAIAGMVVCAALGVQIGRIWFGM